MIQKEKGAILLLTAIMLPVLLALMGIAVDFANVFAAQTKLQSAADASALAGAQMYIDYPETTPANAKNIANNILKANYPKTEDFQRVTEISPDFHNKGNYYIASLQENVPLYFMPLIHLNTVQIHARATALIQDKTQNNPNPKAVLVDNNSVKDSESSSSN